MRKPMITGLTNTTNPKGTCLSGPSKNGTPLDSLAPGITGGIGGGKSTWRNTRSGWSGFILIARQTSGNGRNGWMRFQRRKRRSSSSPGRSDLIPHLDPVVPVINRLLGLVISVDHLQLRQRHRQGPLVFPWRLDKHLFLTLVLRCHANDLHLVPDPQGRDRPLADAAGQEWEGQLILKVVVPAHRPLLLVVGIHNDLHRDPFLTGLVPLGLLRLLGLRHRFSLSPAQTFGLPWRCLPLSTIPARCGDRASIDV